MSTAPSPPSAPINLRQLCARFAQPHLGKAVWQLINTLPLFAAIWALMAWSIHAQWNYLWTLLLALPAAGLYVRTFIIQHDCGHGSYFASAKANNIVGGVPGPDHDVPLRLLAQDPLRASRHLGQSRPARDGRHRHPHRRRIPGALAPQALLPTASTAARRCCWASARPTSSSIKHRFPFDLPFAWKKEWASVLVEQPDAAAGARRPVAWVIGWKTVLMVHLPILLIAGALGVWLFYVQHTFEHAYWTRGKDWASKKPPSMAVRSTTCRACCTGSPATSATTTSTTWPAASPTTACARPSLRTRRCRRPAADDLDQPQVAPA